MTTIKHIEGFCKINALTEIKVCDNGEYGEDLAVFYTAQEVNGKCRIWYMEDATGYRVPITGLVKQNCSIVLSLNTTARKLLGDIAEIRGHCKQHEFHWISDRIKEAGKRIEGG